MMFWLVIRWLLSSCYGVSGVAKEICFVFFRSDFWVVVRGIPIVARQKMFFFLFF